MLEYIPGSTFLPERPVGPGIIAAFRRPGGGLIHVTAPAMADADAQLAYFAHLATGGATTDIGGRVTLVAVDDDSPRWLSAKLLDDNPAAAEARRQLTVAVDRARQAGHDVLLSAYEPSENLDQLAAELGIPADQVPARFIPLGTKAAGRALFAEAGVPVPPGTPECRSAEELAAELAELVRAGVHQFVLKLSSTDYGGGLGNATIDLRGLAPDHPADLAAAVLERLPKSDVVDAQLGWAGYRDAMPAAGVIGEEHLSGDQLCSPSYQGHIVDGEVHTISTHEQVIGPDLQTFIGSSYPAADAYRTQLMEHGQRVGGALHNRGIDNGYFGVDFIAVRRNDTWRVYGCELNLRCTGTKHGFDITTRLLDTRPDPDCRLRVDGEPRVYLSSDNVIDPDFVGMRPRDLITLLGSSPLRYDHDRKLGITLHMMSALPRYGKFGAVCIAHDLAEAEAMLEQLHVLLKNR